MKVKDVMHPDTACFGPDTPLAQVVAKMRADHVDAVPISEYDRLVGVVTERGLRDTAKTEGLTARDVMSKPIVYCYPEEEADDARHIMEKHAVHRLPVVSHQKRIIGSLSFEDVADKAGREARMRH
jgi:CBS domain-containing protein